MSGSARKEAVGVEVLPLTISMVKGWDLEASLVARLNSCSGGTRGVISTAQ